MYKINLKMLTTTALLAFTMCSLSSQSEATAPQYDPPQIIPAASCTDVTLSPDGTTLYVRMNYDTNNDGFRTIEVDPPTYNVLGDCTFGTAPWTSDISSDGTILWTAEYYGGTAQDIQANPLSCNSTCAVSVGSWPVSVLFDDARRFLFIGENHPGGNYDVTGTVQIFDTQNCTVDAVINLNGQASNLNKAFGDPYMYVMNDDRGGHTATLFKISTVTHTLEGTLQLPDSGRVGFSVSPDGAFIYVPAPKGDHLYVIDANAMQIANTISMPGLQCFYVAPSGDHAIAIRPGMNGQTMAIVDLSDFSITQTFDVPNFHDEPKGNPEWALDGKTMYIGQNSDGAIVLKQSPPSDCLTLDVTNLIAGQRADFTVTTGTPGAQVAILWSNKDGQYTTNNGKWCVDFGFFLPPDVMSKLVSMGRFDQNGKYLPHVKIPAGASGMNIRFQAAESDTCPDTCMSNIWQGVVQ